ncbi:MAG: hypothetical protein HQK73_07470 [Desulfamplus sp.]|nr:hypothetical protein [Desulfamplus sp.]
MIDIKKYSNGRFFDVINRKYIKPDRIKELIKKGEQIKVTLTTTGEEITEAVLDKYTRRKSLGKKASDISDNVKENSANGDLAAEKSENEDSAGTDSRKSDSIFNVESMKNWVLDVIDRRINQVIEIMNLPTRDQIAELNDNIKSINQKIDALEASKLESISKSNVVKDSEPLSESTVTFKNSEMPSQDSEPVSDVPSEQVSDIFLNKQNPFEEYAEKKTNERKNVKRRTRKKI